MIKRCSVSIQRLFSMPNKSERRGHLQGSYLIRSVIAVGSRKEQKRSPGSVTIKD